MKHYFFNTTVNIEFATLRAWVADIFRAVGMRADDAALVAETLAVADARGVFSHGCLRVPLYVKRIDAKSVDPLGTPAVVRERGAMALVDGRNAAGQVVSCLAMNKAIELANTHGVSFVTANNSNHNGAVAYYSMMASSRDMVGFCSSIGGGNLMPAHGGAERKIGNNPFSIAFPALRHEALVLDMAQSVVAKGKIIMAQKTGSKIPEQWALDANGSPTTDPSAAIDGFLRTMGDYKGSGLSIAIGMLSSMISGAAIGPTLKDVYEDLEPLNIGHSFCAIRLDFLTEVDEFKSNMDTQIDFIKQGKRAPDVEEVFVPGEIEARTFARQMKDGISMPAEVINTLIDLSRRFEIEVPAAQRDESPHLVS
ncbi:MULTISPECIES: Ldh family oxidoreductase [unclassified Caballeronia]|uniref:Ldh family oxidoreductase n=1 Tax=unclassified Caballeronia TaxID=2646786 RepID=UPI002027EFAD|nr:MULTISPECIES: Ldh family oxidoreductase [unclassified Caballeronia]MDR5765866.1 Ldh family oxidoreductase [Caballeronia sp. LZ028]